ncbi:MAG: ABC transporter ATP-binding protein [Gemmatimonadaceae bacterium]|jgi:ABC-type bacteriocin/lantibiotic exporter with double-glycine peptidase domain|nr:ABC transporter ATP-binding protein [Gemmatimonadaceae bacterium]
MPSRQDIEISLLVAESLGVELTPETRTIIARRRDVGPLADRLRAVGGAMGISYLTRTLDAGGVRDAVRARTAPLLLLAANDDVIITGVDRSAQDAAAVRVDVAGVVHPIVGDTDTVARAIVGLVGPTVTALAPLSLAAPQDPLRTTLEMMVETRSMPAAQAPRKERNVFARVAQLLARDKRDIIILFAFAALAGLFALTLPLSVGAIVQLVQGGLVLQPVVILIGYVVVGTMASGGLQILQLQVVERIQQRVFARLALEFTFRVSRIQYEVAMQEDLPETMNRLFEAVNIQKSLSKFLLDTSTAMLTVVAGLVLLTFYHPYFTFFGVLLLAVLGGILWWSGPRGLESSLMESKYKYRAVHWLEEQARAFHAFKFAGRSPLGVQRMDEILTSYLVYRGQHFQVLKQQTIAIVIFRTLVVGGFLILGTQLVIDRQISLGQFVASELIIVTVLAGVEKLILSMSTIYDILTSAEKAGHVSDLPLDDSGGTALPQSPIGMSLELRNVTYRYHPGARAVLRNATAAVRPGERVGITGYEGAGRTTLLKLMSGLLGEHEGTLLFDGQPLRTLDRTVLREQIGQYMSSSDLFDGTIAENVAVGRPGIDLDAVQRAIAAVGLTREIQDMPNGVDTPITHGGKRLPHDTAIKLLFAQAIAGAPRLLVIDDLFQNLQGDDRRRLVDLVNDRSRDWTVLVVSHDPALLAKMDRVIVLVDGAISAEAPFSALQDDPYVRYLIDSDRRSSVVPGGR